MTTGLSKMTTGLSKSFYAVSVALSAFLTVSGCQTQRAANIEILFHEGDCLWIAEGLSAEQAEALSKDWEFVSGCAVTVRERSGSK